MVFTYGIYNAKEKYAIYNEKERSGGGKGRGMALFTFTSF